MEETDKQINELLITARLIFSMGGKSFGIIYLSKLLYDLFLKLPELIAKWGDAIIKVYDVIDKIKQRKK